MPYKKNQTLIITTGYFPFGNVEKSFLVNEIEYLASAYKKVIIIPQNFNGEISSLPPNVEVNYAFKQVDRKLYFSIRMIFSFFYVFFTTMLNTPYKVKNIIHFRYLFAFFRSIWSQYLVFKKAIRPYLKSEDIVLYSFWYNSYATALCLLKREYPQLKLIARAHGFDLYNERTTIGFQPFRIFQLKFTDKLFIISKTGFDYLSNIYPQFRDKFELSYLGTPEVGTNPSGQGEQLHLISCAYVSKVKRLHLIPQILSYTKTKIKWTHIGGGELLEELKKNTIDLPSNVQCEFLGSVDNNNVQSYFRNNHIDLLISVSESEGIPFGMMEAASFGVPIITTNVGGVKEIVNSETGLLIERDFDPKSVASVLDSFRSSQLATQTFRVQCKEFWNKTFNANVNYEKFIQQIPGINEVRSTVLKQCSRCLLDSTDDLFLELDSHGVCNYCRKYDSTIKGIGSLAYRTERLRLKVEQIKKRGKGKKYDCILGVSGGVDSSYLTYWAHEQGLRPLIVHMDNGWNSELAVQNIQALCSKLGFDLYTHVIDWEEFRKLQLAYLRASVVDIEVLTDHAISAVIYKLAAKHKIRYAINGYNYVTEAIMPKGWTYDKTDYSNIKDIAYKFGGIKKFKSYPTITFVKKFYYFMFLKLEPVHVLNYLDYNKSEAKKFLIEKFGWRDYGGKHFESVFTKFYQIYILPRKFKIDKRKAHLSNLICSGQITKEQAIQEMQLPLYNEQQMKEEKEYVLKKFNLTETEFEKIMQLPPMKHSEFETDQKYWNMYFSTVKFVKRLFFIKSK